VYPTTPDQAFLGSNVVIPQAARTDAGRVVPLTTPGPNGGVIHMKNTSLGYSYNISASITKSFGATTFLTAAYNFSDSKSVNDGGSIAASIFRDRAQNGDPNQPLLANSNFLVSNRFILSGSHRVEYAKNFATSFAAFFQVQSAGRYSYTTGGDANGDQQNNDLIFIPQDRSQAILQPYTTTYAIPNTLPVVTTSVLYTAAEQWDDLNAFIEQDPYLKTRRGQYADRNGAELPLFYKLDLRVLQDIYLNVGGKRHTLQLSVDVFNFLNLLNDNWGIQRNPARATLMEYQGLNQAGQPVYRFPFRTNPNPNNPQGIKLTETNAYDFNIGSRWQLQVGARYIFND
jgi:hypothetical protein